MGTEEQLIKLGFVLRDSYDHETFHTKIYSNGGVTVDLDFENGKLINIDIAVIETHVLNASMQQIKELVQTNIFTPNHNHVQN
jgi:hypothetical protein